MQKVVPQHGRRDKCFSVYLNLANCKTDKKINSTASPYTKGRKMEEVY